MAGKTIDVLFGVKGGGSISGESGALILSQLKGIVSDIEAQGVTTLKFQVDTSALKASKLSAEEAKEAIENLKVEQQAAKTVEQKLKTAISETRLEREKQTNELKKEQAAAKAAAAAKKEEEAAARKAAKAAADEAKAKEKAEKQKIKEQNNDYSIASKNYKKYAQLNSMLQKNEKAIKKAGYWDEGLTLLGQFKEADFKNVREAESAFDTYRKKLVDAGVETDTFGKKISRLFNEHFNTALAMAGVHALQQALYGIYQNVVDIDKAVTDLQVATGGTRDSARELVAEYSEMAMELGATTVEVASAADTWLRQGKTVEEANQLIRQSMILSKLGQIESAEASTALTSALNGYKLEAEDAANVVDKLIAVDMEAAASSGGLAVSMSETANSARIAGIDMDKLIGQIATVTEVTQESGEVIGNSFKTIYSRMGNVKAGRLMDPETGESLSNVEATLSGLGIQLRESDSEFRNFGEVLDEVGAKWNSFSSVQQRAVAVAFAGTRQQEKFLALMENYDRSLELMDVAANSAGVGEQRFADAYLTSIEAAQNRFTASFEKLSTSVLDGGIVTGLMDIASALMSVLTPLAYIVGIADGLPIKIVAVVTGLWGLSKVLKSIQSLKGLSILNNLGFKDILLTLPRTVKLFGSLVKESKSVTTAIKGMNAAMAGANINPYMLAIQAAALVIGGLVWAIDACITTTEEYREQLKETAQEYQNLKTESDNLNSELETTKDRIAELQELADKGTISITEEAELTRLQQQNAELERQIALLDEKKKRETEDAQKEFIGGVEKEIDLHPVDRVEEAVGQGETYGNLSFVGYDFEDIDNVLRLQKYYSEILDEQENKNISLQNSLEENQEVIEKFADANNEALQNLYDAGYLYGMNEEVDAYIDKINEFNDAYLLFTGNSDGLFNQILNRPQFEEANKALTELGKNGEATAENLQSLYNSNSDFKEFIDYIASIPGYIDWESIVGEDAFEKAAGDDGFLNQKEAEALAVDHIAEVLGLVANEFKNTQEAEEDATNAIPKFLSNMKLTEDQLKQINGEADGSLASLTARLNELSSEYDKFMEGNVALGSRRILPSAELNVLGYDAKAGQDYIDYHITEALSKNFGEYTQDFGITITPVLEDGSVISEDELNDYLKELENSIEKGWTKGDILEWDAQRKSLILNVNLGISPNMAEITEAVYADEIVDEYLGVAKTISASIAAESADVVRSAAETLSGIVKDIDDTGSLSNDNLLSIFDQFSDVPELYKYIDVLTDASSTSGQLKQALQELYAAYVAQSGLLENINELNRDQIVTQMELLGVVNAEQVAMWALSNSYSETYRAFALAQAEMTNSLDQELRKRLEKYDIEIEAITSMGALLKVFQTTGSEFSEDEKKQLMQWVMEYGFKAQQLKSRLDALDEDMPDIDLNIPDFSSDSQDSKAPGELALERWREYYDNLKHLREMDEITDAQYYQALEQNYRNYLGNYEETADTLRSVQEELHKHEKEVIQNQWDEYYDSLKHMREMDLLTDRQYYTSLIANANNYLTKYEDMADTLKSIQEEVYSYLKDLYKEDLESQKDALEKKKDDLKDFYDRQKEMLQDQYDEEDEQEKREDYAHEIAKLQLLISSLQRDTTQEAKRRLAEAEEELAQLQEEYDDWEKENARNDALDALDEQYEAEAAKLDSQIEDIDNTIQSIDDGVGGIYNIVKAWAKKNGYDVSGLATGTNSAIGGLYRTQEQGAEMLGYNLGSGQFTYLTPQSKVWNAAATQVLYDFANSPLRFLSRYKGITAGNIPQVRNISLSFGDIVVNGKADASTVAALRKERTNIAYVVLEQLKKLK